MKIGFKKSHKEKTFTIKPILREVSDKELSKIMSESLKPISCVRCHAGIEVRLGLPVISAPYVEVVCNRCGYRDTRYDCSETFMSDSKFATPVTYESLARGIFNAVENFRFSNRNKR